MRASLTHHPPWELGAPLESSFLLRPRVRPGLAENPCLVVVGHSAIWGVGSGVLGVASANLSLNMQES